MWKKRNLSAGKWKNYVYCYCFHKTTQWLFKKSACIIQFVRYAGAVRDAVFETSREEQESSHKLSLKAEYHLGRVFPVQLILSKYLRFQRSKLGCWQISHNLDAPQPNFLINIRIRVRSFNFNLVFLSNIALWWVNKAVFWNMNEYASWHYFNTAANRCLYPS